MKKNIYFLMSVVCLVFSVFFAVKGVNNKNSLVFNKEYKCYDRWENYDGSTLGFEEITVEFISEGNYIMRYRSQDYRYQDYEHKRVGYGFYKKIDNVVYLYSIGDSAYGGTFELNDNVLTPIEEDSTYRIWMEIEDFSLKVYVDTEYTFYFYMSAFSGIAMIGFIVLLVINEKKDKQKK